MSRKTEASISTPPLERMSSMARSGVATTPTSDERLAATTAPLTLPRAMPVSATEDWTVDGTSVRKRMPW